MTDYYERSGLTAPLEAARLQPRRLRLHDLHRELRPAAGRDLGRDRAGRPRGRVGAVGQPQLRGPHPLRGEDELPRLAAAGGRLRARRAHGRRPHHRAARRGGRRRARLPARHLAHASARSTTRSSTRSQSEMFTRSYADVYAGDERWNSLEVPAGDIYDWRESHLREAAAVLRRHAGRAAAGRADHAARACWRCWATASRPTTSRPPARSGRDSPAGRYLIEHGVEPRDFNSYGSRRGNHEVMMRGTFANVRLRNQLVPGHGGLLDGAPPERRADDDLRRRDALHGGGRAAGRDRRQGVRVRLLARLGREGPAAARRARRDRRRATSASTAPTWSGWASCRCSSPTARAPQSLGPRPGSETFDVADVARGRRATTDGDGPPGRRRRRSRSTPRCGSTRRRNGSTTATAASCTSCCASCSARERRLTHDR